MINRLLLYIGWICLFFISSNVLAFDYSQYQVGSLEEINKQKSDNLKILTPKKISFKVELIEYPKNCNANLVKSVMITLGVPVEIVNQIPISKCIKVKSHNGQFTNMYIQDNVAEFLKKEIAIGNRLTLFCDFLFIDKNGAGIIVNEFNNQ